MVSAMILDRVIAGMKVDAGFRISNENSPIAPPEGFSIYKKWGSWVGRLVVRTVMVAMFNVGRMMLKRPKIA